MKKKLKHIFNILRNGNSEEIREAKKEIDALWKNNRKAFEKNANTTIKQMREFDSIQSLNNQVAFVSGLSLFFFVLSDTHFEELKNFVLKVICHPNGHVREQMRKTADWLYISLYSRINPFIYPDKQLTQKQLEEQTKAKNQCTEYLNGLELLMEKYDDGSYDSVEYIDEMKPSIYKSLQLLWNDLNRGNIYQDLHTPDDEILSKRKKIEEELSAILRKTNNNFTLEDIQDIIYNETEFDDLSKVIRMLDIGSPYELENIIEIVNDAWNYFPHKILKGLCPVENLCLERKKLLN